MEQLSVIHLSVRRARAMRLSARSVCPMPPMKHISPRIQVGYVFQHTLVPQCMDAYSDDGTAGCDTLLSASCSNDALVSPFSVIDATNELR